MGLIMLIIWIVAIPVVPAVCKWISWHLPKGGKGKGKDWWDDSGDWWE